MVLPPPRVLYPLLEHRMHFYFCLEYLNGLKWPNKGRTLDSIGAEKGPKIPQTPQMPLKRPFGGKTTRSHLPDVFQCLKKPKMKVVFEGRDGAISESSFSIFGCEESGNLPSARAPVAEVRNPPAHPPLEENWSHNQKYTLPAFTSSIKHFAKPFLTQLVPMLVLLWVQKGRENPPNSGKNASKSPIGLWSHFGPFEGHLYPF